MASSPLGLFIREVSCTGWGNSYPLRHALLYCLLDENCWFLHQFLLRIIIFLQKIYKFCFLITFYAVSMGFSLDFSTKYLWTNCHCMAFWGKVGNFNWQPPLYVISPKKNQNSAFSWFCREFQPQKSFLRKCQTRRRRNRKRWNSNGSSWKKISDHPLPVRRLKRKCWGKSRKTLWSQLVRLSPISWSSLVGLKNLLLNFRLHGDYWSAVLWIVEFPSWGTKDISVHDEDTYSSSRIYSSRAYGGCHPHNYEEMTSWSKYVQPHRKLFLVWISLGKSLLLCKYHRVMLSTFTFLSSLRIQGY